MSCTSAPYFTAEEAARIKATKVEIPDDVNAEVTETSTVEDAIISSLANFFEKRKASGDSRSCGPHDMAPVYQRVFGIEKEDIKDEKFLSRLRRVGLLA
jgi:hypothetical protein